MFFVHHNNWSTKGAHKETSLYFDTQKTWKYYKIFGLFREENWIRRASLLAYKVLSSKNETKSYFFPLCKVELTKIRNKDGTLREQISNQKSKGEHFSFFQIISWSIQILNGLECLKENDPIVVHRDLKPE